MLNCKTKLELTWVGKENRAGRAADAAGGPGQVVPRVPADQRARLVRHRLIFGDVCHDAMVNSKALMGREWLVQRLTWDGHEFLESAKDDAVCAQARSVLGGVGGFTFAAAQAVLIELIKKKLGLS